MALEQALRGWTESALSFVNENGGIVRDETDTWIRDGNRFVRRTWSRLIYRPEIMFRTLRIPQFQTVLREVAMDAFLSGAFRRYVGPESGMGTIFDEQSILHAFLPNDTDPRNPKQRLEYDEQQFDEGMRDLNRFRDEREVSFIQIYPLIGLQAEEPIEIERGLRIEPMNDEEIIEALTWGVLPTTMNQYREYSLAPGTTFALKRRYTVPRVVLGGFPPPQAATNGEHVFGRDSQVPHVLSILAKGRVELGPRFMYSTAGWPYGVHTISQPKAYSDERGRERNMSLSRGVEPDAQRTWSALQGSAGFYKIAARRFYQSHMRDFAEDRLIDDAICGEALLTAQSRDKKSSRFRLNAAYYLGENDHAERLRVFSLFRSAYRIRSAIVHGDEPDPADVQIRGAAVKLYEFEEAFESELRRILRKMADTGDAAAAMQWAGIVTGKAP